MSLRRLNEHMATYDLAVSGGLNNVNFPSSAQGLRLTGSGQGPSISGFGRKEHGYTALVTNVGSLTIFFLHQNNGSSAANRLLIGGSTTLSLAANAVAIMWYDEKSTGWRIDR